MNYCDLEVIIVVEKAGRYTTLLHILEVAVEKVLREEQVEEEFEEVWEEKHLFIGEERLATASKCLLGMFRGTVEAVELYAKDVDRKEKEKAILLFEGIQVKPAYFCNKKPYVLSLQSIY